MILPPLPIPFWDNDRWTLRDVAEWLKPGNEARPDDGERDVSTLDARTPLERLERDVPDVLDLRGLSRTRHYPANEWGWFRDNDSTRNVPIRAKPYGKRKASKTTAICLHTTAVDMGPKRYLGTPVQTGVAGDGTVVLAHDVCTLVAHGHAANRFSVGVEISGHSDIGPDQVEPARHLLRYIQAEILRRRGLEGDTNDRIAVMTHFQATSKRSIRDPGEQIWRELGEWGIEELGLVMGPTIADGQPVPERWRR